MEEPEAGKGPEEAEPGPRELVEALLRTFRPDRLEALPEAAVEVLRPPQALRRNLEDLRVFRRRGRRLEDLGRLVDPEEAARAVNFVVSADAGLMTGAVINFDQSVWGAVAGGMPVPDGPMTLNR